MPAGLGKGRRGVAQCNYELLRAFGGWMDASNHRFTLGAGTLLGAMRNEPPGLLQWEHDVDVYVPARDASLLLQKPQARNTRALAMAPRPPVALRRAGRLCAHSVAQPFLLYAAVARPGGP